MARTFSQCSKWSQQFPLFVLRSPPAFQLALHAIVISIINHYNQQCQCSAGTPSHPAKERGTHVGDSSCISNQNCRMCICAYVCAYIRKYALHISTHVYVYWNVQAATQAISMSVRIHYVACFFSFILDGRRLRSKSSKLHLLKKFSSALLKAR